MFPWIKGAILKVRIMSSPVLFPAVLSTSLTETTLPLFTPLFNLPPQYLWRSLNVVFLTSKTQDRRRETRQKWVEVMWRRWWKVARLQKKKKKKNVHFSFNDGKSILGEVGVRSDILLWQWKLSESCAHRRRCCREHLRLWSSYFFLPSRFSFFFFIFF